MPDAEAYAALMEKAVASMSASIVQDVSTAWTATVPSMVANLLASARPVTVTLPDRPTVTINQTHAAFEDVLDMVLADTQPLLVGPAGSGKTTLGEQIAKALGLKFYMASRISSEHKLMGYFHPHNGELIKTPFRLAWEFGGVFLLDEVDASDADALTAINAALAGNIADFPDGIIARHPDFKCIAAGNTFGRGADRVYVGRNQLDGATLDRFQILEVDYDEALELMLAGNDEWARWVQKVRAAVMAEKVLHIVSPRASIAGAKLLARGWSHDKVAEACVWKGLDKAQRNRITNRMNGGF
jgi:MoxR-like ATPase